MNSGHALNMEAGGGGWNKARKNEWKEDKIKKKTIKEGKNDRENTGRKQKK